MKRLFGWRKPELCWLGGVLAITVLGGVLRFAALGAKTLWLDEAFSLWVARHDLPTLFAWLTQIDHHPPLYYALLHFWVRWFGDSAEAIRSLSALTSTLAIPVFAWGTRRLAGAQVGAQVGMVAALLLAISPFHLRYAQETRMYGVLTLAVALLLLAVAYVITDRYVVRSELPSRKFGNFLESVGVDGWAWGLLVVAQAAAMLSHNTATVLVPLAVNGAMGSLWLFRRHAWVTNEFPRLQENRFWQAWVMSQVGAFVLWSPWALRFVRQAQSVDGGFWIEAPDTWAVWMALVNLTFAHLPAWLPQRDYWAWVAVILVVVGLWVWRRQVAANWLLLAWWLIPPVVELVVSLRRPIFYDRTLIWTTLPMLILVARGMVLPKVQGARSWRAGWLVGTLSLYTFLCGIGIWGYYTDFAKEDWDRAALFVASEAQADELLLFHASWAQLPFDYYYEGRVSDEAPNLIKHGLPADLFDAGVLEPPMTQADVPRLLTLVEGRDALWLVYSHWWYTDPDGLLLQALDEDFMIAEEQAWPGIRVMRFVRR